MDKLKSNVYSGMPCNRNTFCCVQAFGLWREKIKHMPDCCRSHLKVMLKDLVGVFTRNNIHYWLDWGGLLGLVREGDLISYDSDLDFGVFVEDLHKMNALADEINGMGYDYCLSDGIGYHGSAEAIHPRVYFSKINKIYADICVYGPLPDGYVNLVFHNAEHTQRHKGPRKFYENLDSIQYQDFSINIPNNVNTYLEMRYGPNWREPDPLFYYNGGIEARIEHAATMAL